MAQAQGVYWIGGDNNIYTKVAGQNGVKNVGPLGVTNPKNFSGLQEIADPSAPAAGTNSSTYTNSGGGGGGSGSGSGNGDLSSYNQAIDATNAQINNLDPALNGAITDANNGYQTTVNQLLQGKTNADKTYSTNKTTDAQDFVGAKSTIRANTGSTINGIDSVLGSHGGGGQEAGNYAALLAGKAGTSQLTGASTNFGKNEQNLDTNYNDYLTGYNNNMTNASLQKDSEIKKATASIYTQKANLLQNLASLINERTSASGGSGTAASQPYADQAKDLLTKASTIGAPTSVAAVTPTTYTPPSLTSYTTNPTTVTAGGTAATDTTQPFYNTLLNRDKKLQAA
jgi:hypothetical protein